jgi:hypothetical protein
MDGSQSRGYNLAAMHTAPPIACNLDAFDEMQQRRRVELASRLQKAVLEIVPIADGYTFRLAMIDKTLVEIAEFVSLERRCCPFLTFQIEVEGENSEIHLRLSGRPGVKEFLAAEFGIDATDDRVQA